MASLARPMAKNSIPSSPILLDINDLLYKYNSDRDYRSFNRRHAMVST